MLVVTGDHDATCLPEASRHMAGAIPGARLVVLALAKHCGLFEHHKQFHAAVVEFLAPWAAIPSQTSHAPEAVPSPRV